MKLPTRLTPSVLTVTMAVVLGGAAFAFTVLAGSEPVFDVGNHIVWPATVLVLAALFTVGELALMHIEFRHHAYSYSLSTVPIALGLAAFSPRDLVVARVLGSLAAFVIQRPSAVKMAYNLCHFAFEAAAAAFVVHRLLGTMSHLTLGRGVVVYAVLAVLDVVMSGLVLLVIVIHQGAMPRRTVLAVLPAAVVFTLASTAVAFEGLLLLGDGPFGYTVLGLLTVGGIAGYHSYQRLHRRHDALAMVHTFIEEAAPDLVAERVSETLLERIRDLMNATRTELVMVGQGSVTRLVVTEDGAYEAMPTVDPDDDWLLARVRVQGEPMLVPRHTRDRGLQLWLHAHGFRDALVVPVRSATSNGALVVSDRLGEASSFTREDLTLLETLGGHLTVALQNARLVDRLRYEATHDSLTSLANRALLRRVLQEALEPDRADQIAVLLIDLDRFKEVNDALGHHTGDELLKVVAARLTACAPAGGLVARLGGDEFAVLMPAQPEVSVAAERLAREIVAAVFEPVRLSDATLNTQISIGIAISNSESTHTDVLRNADTAMYAAKSHDDSIVIYDPELDRGRSERLALGADLQLALNRDELELHYQPQLDLATGRISGVEALVRWNHPRLGLLNPETFIPLAETNGLIEQLTPLVLRMALRQCRLWADEGLDVTVAVNLSARNVSNIQLPEMVSFALAEAGLPADRLVLEITESSVMDDPERTVPILVRLASTGVALSLDDFGTGYSSLSYLQRLPVREVKIDRSFVRGLGVLGDARASEALIRSIAGLGESLQLNVVAEGVEDAQTVDQLRLYGCDVAQGYYVGRPEPADRITATLRQAAGLRPLKSVAQ
ncbi:MAG: hypothetical protein QOJ62_2985 [Actinomycetota bacterium]|nr:hypothetical protein [Actinomycetota bacterium]